MKIYPNQDIILLHFLIQKVDAFSFSQLINDIQKRNIVKRIFFTNQDILSSIFFKSIYFKIFFCLIVVFLRNNRQFKNSKVTYRMNSTISAMLSKLAPKKSPKMPPIFAKRFSLILDTQIHIKGSIQVKSRTNVIYVKRHSLIVVPQLDIKELIQVKSRTNVIYVKRHSLIVVT